MTAEAKASPTAAIILIGNELLSGKIVDRNGAYLVSELRALGVALREVNIISDELEPISRAASELSERNDYVFTSGGVGPTHDDLTLDGLAAAFGVGLVENGTMAHHIHAVFAQDEDRRQAFMKMALVPEGTTLMQNADLLWPVYCIRNVYVLPGVPEIFRRQFDAIKDRFRSQPFYLRTIYFRVDEGELAPTVTKACRHFPGVSFGSYPVWDKATHRVRVTIESKTRARVEDAYKWMVERIRADKIFKVVDGAT